MKLRCWLLAVLTLVSEPSGAAPTKGPPPSAEPPLAAPRAMASLRGPNPSYVGQMVRIEVELLRDDRQAEKPAPFFPELRVRDAIALLSSHAPPPEQRTIDGVEFLVQKRIYLVFPQVPGDFTVPSIPVALPGPAAQELLVPTEPLTLHADIPRGAGSRLPLIARNVRLERVIEGEMDHLRVGDALSVSLKLTATDTDPVLLPILELPEIPGLSRYPGEAKSYARADRGEYVAERTEEVTYVAHDFGFYQLPRLSVLWLDPSTGKYAEAVAPPLSFRARVNPHLGTGCIGGPRAVGLFGGALGGLGFLGITVLWLVRRITARREARARVHKTEGERAAFAALRAAASSGRDGAALSALYRWLRYVVPDLPTLRAWLAMSSDESLHRAVIELEARVSQGTGPGHAGDILAPASAYRNGMRARASSTLHLPELNAAPNQASGARSPQ